MSQFVNRYILKNMKYKIGENIPQEFNVVVEIPAGSNIKYEIDVERDLIQVDRILSTSMSYIGNYGFIPETKAKDGDTLDVLIMLRAPLQIGSLIVCRSIGFLEMEDENLNDKKIIALPAQKIDPEYAQISDVYDLSQATRKKIFHFFQHYKDNEDNPNVKIGNFEGKTSSMEEIVKAHKSYLNLEDE